MPIRGVMFDMTAVPGAASWEAYLANFSPELAEFLTEIAGLPLAQCTSSAPTAFLEGCRLIGQVPEEVVFLDPRPRRIEEAREAGLLAVLLREPVWDVRFEVESLCYENHPELYLGEMSWADVDPSGHTMDLGRVRQVADAHIPANPDEYALRSAEFALHHELLAEFGYWIQGWRWTARDSGGPVRAWQDGHSLLYDENEDASEPPAFRVVRAVEEWQSFLIELRQAFEPCEDLEKTALRLLPLVVRYTEANDAWYNTFSTVLEWYLEYRGLDSERYRAEIGNTVGGRFQSWCAPLPNESAQVCSMLGSIKEIEPAPVDAMVLWIATRPTQAKDWLTWREPKAVREGHSAFIELEETGRCHERAQRMLTALTCSRRWALSGRPMDFSDLQDWNGLILGEEAKVRTTPAFAKRGRERYGYPFLEQFLALLSDPGEGPLCFRAARAYLDVCFFHPFVDGNARLARLVLDAILWREEKALNRVDPVFCMSRSVVEGACWNLASEINQMLTLRPQASNPGNA
ncbi:MAG: Fic family protein [Candidatus Eremiobacteraeota bacterium]|nr:Fic family protein [Candidatus Eremiobacteraeota bacterium]